MLNQLFDQHYQNAIEAKQRGKACGLGNIHITAGAFRNHGHSCGLSGKSCSKESGARKCALELLEHSESNGYSTDICSYARVNLGYMEVLESPAGNIPLPDLIFCCNNICNTVLKWYENIAKELNIPMILIDLPFNHEYEVTEQNVRYIRGQLSDAIKQLEKLTERSFDYEKFHEIMKISSETAGWWKKLR